MSKKVLWIPILGFLLLFVDRNFEYSEEYFMPSFMAWHFGWTVMLILFIVYKFSFI